MIRFRSCIRSLLVRALAGAVLTGASGLVMVHAQQQAQAAQPAEQQLQEVIVTGTMIKRTNAETAVSITILKADALKDQGITSVEQALDQLTANNSAINIAQSVGTFSGGGSYVDLRGLGPGRTLVLLDGHRLALNAFSGNAVDLSGIPFSAIESIEVLKEGASSLYGSDAVSGVINFKTRKNYQGLSFSGTYDKPERQGGSSSEVEGTFGHGDLANDGYNIMLTAGWSKQNELQASARDFSAEGFDPVRGFNGTNNPGSFPGSAIDANGNLWQAGYPACAGNPYLTTALGNCAYRYAVATDLLPQHAETSALASITKSIGTNNSLQLQYFWAQSNVNGFAGPVFYPYGQSPTSPYLPGNAQGPSLASLTCLGNFFAGGPCTAPPNFAGGAPLVFWSDPNNNRYGGNLNTEQRALLTFAGNSADWDYAASVNYSQNKNDNRWTGGIPNFAVSAPGGVLSDLINPYGPQSAAGQALINQSYINGTYSNGEDKRWSLDAHASHELGDAIAKDHPATVALGLQVGGEHFDYATTAYNLLVQASTGLGPSAVEGARTFQALFLELDLPITSTLDVTIADRQDWYSDFGTTNNPKVQATWQPASFVKFRGTASTGFRAPTLFSLNNPPSLAASTAGTMGIGNPDCVNAGATPPSAIPPFTPATCNTQGLGLFGGDKNLTPETSQNFDFGVVLTPAKDLGITLDYYRILVKNTISAVPATAIYGNPTEFASYYVVGSGGLTASINSAVDCIPYTAPTCGYIKVNSANTGHLSTDGIDLSVQYAQHTSIGTFREDLEGTATTQFLDQLYTGGPTLNLVGWYNQGLTPAYRFQTNFRLDWTSPEGMWGAGLGHRWWSGYIDQADTCAQPGSPANCVPAQRYVGSYGVWEGYVSVKPMKQLTVLFGIKNLTDHLPPYTNATQGNFSSGYNALIVDPTQRSFYLNVKADIF